MTQGERYFKGVLVGGAFGGILVVPLIVLLVGPKDIAVLVAMCAGAALALLVTKE